MNLMQLFAPGLGWNDHFDYLKEWWVPYYYKPRKPIWPAKIDAPYGMVKNIHSTIGIQAYKSTFDIWLASHCQLWSQGERIPEWTIADIPPFGRVYKWHRYNRESWARPPIDDIPATFTATIITPHDDWEKGGLKLKLCRMDGVYLVHAHFRTPQSQLEQGWQMFQTLDECMNELHYETQHQFQQHKKVLDYVALHFKKTLFGYEKINIIDLPSLTTEQPCNNQPQTRSKRSSSTKREKKNTTKTSRTTTTTRKNPIGIKTSKTTTEHETGSAI